MQLKSNLLPYLFLILFSLSYQQSTAQVDESQTGAWYMYFYNFSFDDSRWGIQGDIQYRDWEIMGDPEQLLLRSGVTYRPENTNLLLTIGYANITSGQFGDSTANTVERRAYQEALLPWTVGERLLFTHRFRYEQRWVENQDFRTRYRYNLFLNIPLNNTTLDVGTVYVALYNELFINGQRNIGRGRRVDWFDRNRAYMGLGYVVNPRSRIQVGWMNQATVGTDKGQLQFSLHQKF